VSFVRRAQIAGVLFNCDSKLREPTPFDAAASAFDRMQSVLDSGGQVLVVRQSFASVRAAETKDSGL
jgi:hypothetical protein